MTSTKYDDMYSIPYREPPTKSTDNHSLAQYIQIPTSRSSTTCISKEFNKIN